MFVTLYIDFHFSGPHNRDGGARNFIGPKQKAFKRVNHK